jgi:hypothetical protein
MTNIKLSYQNGNITKVVCFGHSGFADYGKDIVCAGISSIVQTAEIGIKNVAKQKCKTEIADGSFSISLEDIDENSQEFHDAQIILKTMVCGLKDLQKQYPKFLKLEVE